MSQEKIFRNKPGRLIAKSHVKKNKLKRKTSHPDYIGVYQDEKTSVWHRVALWKSNNPKLDSYSFQISEIEDETIIEKMDIINK